MQCCLIPTSRANLDFPSHDGLLDMFYIDLLTWLFGPRFMCVPIFDLEALELSQRLSALCFVHLHIISGQAMLRIEFDLLTLMPAG